MIIAGIVAAYPVVSVAATAVVLRLNGAKGSSLRPPFVTPR